MYRIDNATAVPNGSGVPAPAAPGPNVNGFFTNTGVAGTIVDADWANAVQEEICNVITGAGIGLSKTTRNQLLTAIQTLSRGSNMAVYKIVAGTQEVSINGAAFTATGATTFPAIPGSAKVRCWGAGGGAGGTSGNGAIGGSGGGGEYAEGTFAGLTAPTTVTVGAPGTAGTTAPTVGGTGGTSSFGALLTAVGGGGGNNQTGAGSAAPGIAGSGGTGGTLRVGGNPGSFGYTIATTCVGSIAGGSFQVANGVGEVASSSSPGSGTGAVFPAGGGSASIGGGTSQPGSCGLIIVEW